MKRFGRPGWSVARNARLFREARRRLELEISAIIHRNAAAHVLQSGGTIKQIVRALDDSTVIAVSEALDGIATVTRRGRNRQKLLDQLLTSLAEHLVTATAIARGALERIGLGGDFEHAAPLINEAAERHREKINDFGQGWTAPVGRIFKERHPYIYDTLLVLIGAALGFLLQPPSSLSGDGKGAPGKKVLAVAPKVAPMPIDEPTPAEKRELNH